MACHSKKGERRTTSRTLGKRCSLCTALLHFTILDQEVELQ